MRIKNGYYYLLLCVYIIRLVKIFKFSCCRPCYRHKINTYFDFLCFSTSILILVSAIIYFSLISLLSYLLYIEQHYLDLFKPC